MALLVLAARVGVAAGLDACPAPGDAVVSPCAPVPTCAVSAVRVGGRHTCALLSLGGVRCAPAPPSAGHTQALLWLLLSVPALLALTPSLLGFPRCWGDNSHSQLGRESTYSIGDAAGEVASLADVDFGPGRTVVQLVAGMRHNCALLDDAQLCAPHPLSRPLVGCVRLA